jgi:hypothetical protein
MSSVTINREATRLLANPLTAFAYLAVPSGTWPPANDATVQKFSSTGEGAALVAEWRGRAARNVATIRGRMGLMLKGMALDDRRLAEDWFDSLSSAQAKAVLRALVSRRVS